MTGCPGSKAMSLNENISENKSGDLNSQIKQWPIQLLLISPSDP